MVYNIRPLANGLSTDHPVPGLPFVDDSHIPLDEGPEAIEAVGRNQGEGMWGRFDHDYVEPRTAWSAFTTDPLKHEYGWSVRYHPDHGRTVLLMRDDDIASLHSLWQNGPLLYRAGGYWWDGSTWYRPGQIWDPVTEDYERRVARAAVTVSAADMLDGRTEPDRAYVHKVMTFDPEEPGPDTWLDHLALWAQRHQEQENARPLERCLVDLSSPELSGDRLLGVPEMAAMGNITASTLRSYLSRNNSEVPMPQATMSGRDHWSRPVAEDWAESRRRSREGVREVMTAGDRDNLSPGEAAVRDRFAANFQGTLWERPDVRKRWILRSRNEAAVQEVSDVLAWNVATSLKSVLPTDLLGPTIRHAVLDDFAGMLDRKTRRGKSAEEKSEIDAWEIPLSLPLAKMLDWFIRHYPDSAQWYIGEIMHEAHQRWDIPATVTGEALRLSVVRDSKLPADMVNEYFTRVVPGEQSS
ncbi:hypothetical protein ACFVEN_44385 [Streptomyces sp. NPDC057681]|uniref:hypothetical protein n=1 Tax=Streptomyces sp. NPDC057681 TaxID=3346209 RepID=UPI0036B70E78